MRSTVLSKKEFGFTWVDVTNPTPSELDALASEYHIHPMYIQDVLQAEHLPKVEMLSDDNCYFVIARALDPELGTKDFQSINALSRKLAIFYRSDELVTIHRSDFPWLDEIKQKYTQTQTKGPAFELVCRLLKQCFKSFEPLVFKLNDDLDFFEQKLFTNEKFPPLAKSLYSIKRKSAVLKRLFAVSEPVLEILQYNPDAEPAAQDAKDMFTRINTMVDEQNERVSGLINLSLAVSGQRNNEVMRFLTIYSAFFMPLTFLVGVYGMNFEFMPELRMRYGYTLCWIAMLLVAGIHLAWFRKKRWL